jgi:hypothetical protein
MALTFSSCLIINCKLITSYFTGFILHVESYVLQVTTKHVSDFQYGQGKCLLENHYPKINALTAYESYNVIFRSDRTWEIL